MYHVRLEDLKMLKPRRDDVLMIENEDEDVVAVSRVF